jgi:hypothetical protein
MLSLFEDIEKIYLNISKRYLFIKLAQINERITQTNGQSRISRITNLVK